MEMMGKIEFVAIAFDPNNEIFVVYIAFFTNSNLNINNDLFCRAQIASLKV